MGSLPRAPEAAWDAGAPTPSWEPAEQEPARQEYPELSAAKTDGGTARMAGRTAAAGPAAARMAAARTAAARTSAARSVRVAVQAAAAAARLVAAKRAAARLVPARLVAATEIWEGGHGLHDDSHTACEPPGGWPHPAARQADRVPHGSNDGISGAHHEIANAIRHCAGTLEPDHQRERRAAGGQTTSSRRKGEQARTKPAACPTHQATTPADLPETLAADPRQGSRACCQRPSRGRRE